MNKPSLRPIAVELFAGGGGVAVGLKKAGFRVSVAVELDKYAADTYKRNHPRTKLLVGDVRQVGGVHLLELSGGGGIDLLAACPPCQGFCSLTSKYHKEDPRNDLVREVSRIAGETLPKAIMFENVPGLADKGKVLFQELIESLESLGYQTRWKVVQLANYGIPQRRRRLVMLAGLGFAIEIPPETHSFDGKQGMKRWNSLFSAIGHIEEDAIELPDVNAIGGPRQVSWHVVRRISELNRKRLMAAKAGASRQKLPERLRPLCHQSDYDGFTNVYGRMSWDAPSSTITAGCLTLSMGRFGHPEKDRTISLREAALIQTFPPNYVIETDYIDHATQIVGNALPCDFAKQLARQVRKAIARHEMPL